MEEADRLLGELHYDAKHTAPWFGSGLQMQQNKMSMNQ